MALSTLRHAPRRDAGPATDPATATSPGGGSGTTERTGEAPSARRARRDRDANGMAVAAFVLGLLGLLVGNLFLGPTAVVLALLALARGTARRGRALLGLGLGVADLVVLAVLTLGDHTLSWSFAG